MTTRTLCIGNAAAVAGVLLLAGSTIAYAAVWIYFDEAQFLSRAGTVTMESFETIPIDSWIYHTRLPSPIPALDLEDDPNDPNDGPDYDLDGHFAITGDNIAYAPPDELFVIYDGAPSDDEVDGVQYLSFAPYYASSWPAVFDRDDQHPTITFDNFDNSSAGVNAFGFYLYDYTPGSKWIVMEYGDRYVQLNLAGAAGDYFVGVISDGVFREVQLHTNQNGGRISIDEIYYSADAAESLSGDVDGDGDVDVFDAIALVNAFGATPADAHWDPRCDFDGDAQVSVFDAIGLVNNFGASV